MQHAAAACRHANLLNVAPHRPLLTTQIPISPAEWVPEGKETIERSAPSTRTRLSQPNWTGILKLISLFDPVNQNEQLERWMKVLVLVLQPANDREEAKSVEQTCVRMDRRLRQLLQF